MTVDARIEKILEKLFQKGFEAAVVGGAVRDILAGKNPKDWDLTTNAKPEEILKLFKGAFYNNTFGTVGVPVNGNAVEITTYRKEFGYLDKRHPDKVVWGKSLEEDLARRDFTINAIALKFKPKADFALLDPFGGQKDFEKKIIRTVGKADDRFGEDALRMMRAVRFAATLNFEIEKETLNSIKRNAKFLREISGERIRDELFKIIDSPNNGYGVMILVETGLLEVFMPELYVCFDVPQKSPKRHHIFDVGTHCVKSMETCPSQKTIVRFAALLHDVGKAKVAKVTEEGVRTFYNHEVVGAKIAEDIAGRLHLSKDQREELVKLVRWHQFSVGEIQTDAAVRRFIKNVGLENVSDMMDLRVGDRLGGGLQEAESWRLKLYKKRIEEVLKKPFTVADLKIDGNDVMRELGIGPGPKVGEVLNKLFEEVLEDDKKNNREYLLERIKSEA